MHAGAGQYCGLLPWSHMALSGSPVQSPEAQASDACAGCSPDRSAYQCRAMYGRSKTKAPFALGSLSGATTFFNLVSSLLEGAKLTSRLGLGKRLDLLWGSNTGLTGTKL